MRYFRASLQTYEAVRQQLDAAYGYPRSETKTQTAIPPATDAPVDAAGRVYLVASEAECGFDAVSSILPQLLQSGAVSEISVNEYAKQFPSPF